VPEVDDAPSLSKAPDLDRKPAAVLCVSNLSRFAQPAELNLGRWEGCTPIELLGRVPFPKVASKPYSVTLAPYGIYWFELVER
jgi:maltose alpha-D-glucosyltransferase / alpha-amylase